MRDLHGFRLDMSKCTIRYLILGQTLCCELHKHKFHNTMLRAGLSTLTATMGGSHATSVPIHRPSIHLLNKSPLQPYNLHTTFRFCLRDGHVSRKYLPIRTFGPDTDKFPTPAAVANMQPDHRVSSRA